MGSTSVSHCRMCYDIICNNGVYRIYRDVESVLLCSKWVVCIIMVLLFGV